MIFDFSHIAILLAKEEKGIKKDYKKFASQILG